MASQFDSECGYSSVASFARCEVALQLVGVSAADRCSRVLEPARQTDLSEWRLVRHEQPRHEAVDLVRGEDNVAYEQAERAGCEAHDPREHADDKCPGARCAADERHELTERHWLGACSIH